PIKQNLLEVCFGQLLRNHPRVDPRSLESCDLGHFNPVHELHHQETWRGVLPVNPRHDYIVPPGSKVAPDGLSVVPLMDEIQFQRDIAAEFFDDEAEIVARFYACQPCDKERDVAQIQID